MGYQPENLQLWKLPEYYFGESWPDYYVFLSQHRDSDSLTRSNFDCALRDLGGESDTVIIVREGHWAVGWIEWIAIHESDDKALQIADGIVAALSDYPVLDESHWSELEWTEASEYWERISVSERLYYCQKAGISIFAARRDEMPIECLEYLTGN